MMSNTYKRASEKISVPPELIGKTAGAMSAGRRPARVAPVFAMAALCLCIVFGIFIYQGNENVLNFQELPGGFTQSPAYMAGPGAEKESWTIEQYKKYLNADVTPKGLKLQLESETAAVYTKDGEIFSEYYTALYKTEGGGRLEITVSKDKLPYRAVPGLEENSLIKGNPLAIALGKGSGAYAAQFMRGGVGFYIESGDLSREDFIRVLKNFF